MKKLPTEIWVGLLLLAASILALVVSHERVIGALAENWDLILKTLGLTIVAVGISVVIQYVVPDNFAEKYLARTELRHRIRYSFIATILGILTPGPVYAIYPIVKALKIKGVKNPILVSYITGQTIIGPARIPFEVGLFGLKFFAYRAVLSVGMGVLAGLLYALLSRRWPDQKGSVAPKADISARAAESTDL